MVHNTSNHDINDTNNELPGKFDQKGLGVIDSSVSEFPYTQFSTEEPALSQEPVCLPVPLCLCASVPLCPFASLPLCLCASVPLCPVHVPVPVRNAHLLVQNDKLKDNQRTSI